MNQERQDRTGIGKNRNNRVGCHLWSHNWADTFICKKPALIRWLEFS